MTAEQDYDSFSRLVEEPAATVSGGDDWDSFSRLVEEEKPKRKPPTPYQELDKALIDHLDITSRGVRPELLDESPAAIMADLNKPENQPTAIKPEDEEAAFSMIEKIGRDPFATPPELMADEPRLVAERPLSETSRGGFKRRFWSRWHGEYTPNYKSKPTFAEGITNLLTPLLPTEDAAMRHKAVQIRERLNYGLTPGQTTETETRSDAFNRYKAYWDDKGGPEALWKASRPTWQTYAGIEQPMPAEFNYEGNVKVQYQKDLDDLDAFELMDRAQSERPRAHYLTEGLDDVLPMLGYTFKFYNPGKGLVGPVAIASEIAESVVQFEERRIGRGYVDRGRYVVTDSGKKTLTALGEAMVYGVNELGGELLLSAGLRQAGKSTLRFFVGDVVDDAIKRAVSKPGLIRTVARGMKAAEKVGVHSLPEEIGLEEGVQQLVSALFNLDHWEREDGTEMPPWERIGKGKQQYEDGLGRMIASFGAVQILGMGAGALGAGQRGPTAKERQAQKEHLIQTFGLTSLNAAEIVDGMTPQEKAQAIRSLVYDKHLQEIVAEAKRKEEERQAAQVQREDALLTAAQQGAAGAAEANFADMMQEAAERTAAERERLDEEAKQRQRERVAELKIQKNVIVPTTFSDANSVQGLEYLARMLDISEDDAAKIPKPERVRLLNDADALRDRAATIHGARVREAAEATEEAVWPKADIAEGDIEAESARLVERYKTYKGTREDQMADLTLMSEGDFPNRKTAADMAMQELAAWKSRKREDLEGPVTPEGEAERTLTFDDVLEQRRLQQAEMPLEAEGRAPVLERVRRRIEETEAALETAEGDQFDTLDARLSRLRELAGRLEERELAATLPAIAAPAEAEPADTAPGEGKPPELMTPEEFSLEGMTDSKHKLAIFNAVDAKRPISAPAADAYGMNFDGEGYVREGDRYVFKGEAVAESVEPPPLPHSIATGAPMEIPDQGTTTATAAIARTQAIVNEEVGAASNVDVVYAPDAKDEQGSLYEGWYANGRIVINAATSDTESVRQAIREEAAHGRLDTPDGRAAIREFAAARMTEGERNALRDAGYLQEPGESDEDYKLRLADEFIAKQARQKTTVWREIVDHVRTWLADAGIVKLTNEEAARAILRSVTKRGVATRPQVPGLPDSLTDTVEAYAIGDEFQDDKAAQAEMLRRAQHFDTLWPQFLSDSEVEPDSTRRDDLIQQGANLSYKAQLWREAWNRARRDPSAFLPGEDGAMPISPTQRLPPLNDDTKGIIGRRLSLQVPERKKEFTAMEADPGAWLRRVLGADVDQTDAGVGNMAKNAARLLEILPRSPLARGRTKPGAQYKDNASQLERGIIAGLIALQERGVPATHLEEAIEGLGKGKAKVTGVSKSTVAVLKALLAPSFDAAVEIINNQRRQAGKDLITVDTEVAPTEPTAPVVKPAPPGILPPRSLMSPEDRAFWREQAPRRLVADATGQAIIDAVVNGLNLPVPEDPVARRDAVTMVRGLMVDAYDAANTTPDKWADRARKRLAWGRNIESLRYYIGDLASEANRPELYDGFIEGGRRKDSATYEFDEAWRELFDLTGVTAPHGITGKHTGDTSFALVTAQFPELSDAIMVALGVNPNESAEAKEQVEKAYATIRQHEQGERLIELVRKIEQYSRTTAAVDARFVETMRFRRLWMKHGVDYTRLTQPDLELTATQKKKLAQIEQAFNGILPWRYDAEEQTGVQLEIPEMRDAMLKYEELGEDGFRAWLSTADFGSRKYYYMMGPQDRVLDISGELSDILPDIESTPVPLGVTPEASINHRTGVGKFVEGNALANLYHHFRNLHIQARTYNQVMGMLDVIRDLANWENMGTEKGDLAQRLAAGEVSAKEARREAYAPRLERGEAQMLVNLLENMWGKSRPLPDKVSGAIVKAARTFWMARFLSVHTLYNWYAENIFQGLPMGPVMSQYYAADITRALPALFAEGQEPGSRLRTFLTTEFEKSIREAGAMFKEYGMLRQAGEAEEGLGKYAFAKAQLEELGARLAGPADNLARMQTAAIGFMVADRYLTQFVNGEISQGQFERGLRFETMSLQQQRRYRMLLAKGIAAGKKLSDFDELLAEVVLDKNLNVNFGYKTTERSIIEQLPLPRTLINPLRYQVGAFERWWHGAVEPLVRAVKIAEAGGEFDWNLVRGAARTWVDLAVQAAVSGMLLSFIAGDRRNPFNTKRTQGGGSLFDAVFGWTFGGPGTSMLTQLTESIQEVIIQLSNQDIAGSKKAFGKLARNVGFAMIAPIAQDLENAFEAVNNTQGANNMKIVGSFFNEVGEPAYRNTWENIIHALSGRIEEHDPRKVWERMLDQVQIGKALSTFAVRYGWRDPTEWETELIMAGQLDIVEGANKPRVRKRVGIAPIEGE